jgi:NAD(P)-dependent dehydrogenase (short-subunit alcohol dehydrogenase family)
MPGSSSADVVVIGGTSGIGRAVAGRYARGGSDVVISSRSADRAKMAAEQIGGRTTGVELDLSSPGQIADQLSGIEQVDHLVLAAIERDRNSVRDYDLASALRLVTLKLVGYTEVVHALADHMTAASSVVLVGGLAMERPYPGSTTVTTVNGGVSALVRTLAVEMAPIRFNAVHPAMVGDSPYWSDKPEPVAAATRRTPIGRLATMDEIADAIAFLLENPSVNGANLPVDGGASLV